MEISPFLTWSTYELSVGVGYDHHGSGAFNGGVLAQGWSAR
jgi:hypothetical protein